MGVFNAILTRAFDLILAPSSYHPWAGMAAVSLLTGVVLLLIFRYASNQRGIRAAKDRIISDLLEVLLYRDELAVVLRAQLRLAKDNLRYLGHALVPLIFMMPPVLALLVQVDLRYGHRPLREGERAILAVRLRSDDTRLDDVSLTAPAGLEVETAGLRIPTIREVDWRLRAAAPGRYRVQVAVGEEKLFKEIVVEDQGGRVSSRRVGGCLWQQFLNPGEPPLPANGPVAWVKVSYPSAHLSLFGWRLHWVWAWLILSMAFGYALKGPLRVQV